MTHSIELTNVTKHFRQGDLDIRVLNGANCVIQAGEKVAIVGPSGSGKSTLLAIMSGMDRPDSGGVVVGGESIGTLKSDQLADFRNRTVGVIFQSFELVPAFTALENVLLPLDIRNASNLARAKELLGLVGVIHRADHLPGQLSGGEQQRVAIARALAQDPKILFADEPTGNLDHETGAEIIKLLLTLVSQNGTTLIVVTHDPALAERMDRILEMNEGVLQERKTSPAKL